MKNHKCLILWLLGGVFLLNCVLTNAGGVDAQASLLSSTTFYELGYNVTQTYYQDDSLTIQVNCSGSSVGLYSVKIYLHMTGEDILYSYVVNGGSLRSGGLKPGCSFFMGWQMSYLELGCFQEGTNTLRVLIKNCDDDPLTTSSKYLTILTDSYIEIYDGAVSHTLTGTEHTSETVFTSQRFSEVEYYPPDGFFWGLMIGALVTGGVLIGWYLSHIRKNEGKSYIVPSKTFFARTTTDHVCSICKQKVMSDQLTKCPNCQKIFHKSHFAEAIKMTGKCPLCKSDVITLDQDGDTKYTTWSPQEK
ncbi:MAG: RING finger protein [Promethearchaeota archaeon]